jgi:hypothetical protein
MLPFLQGIDHLQFEKDMFGNQDIVGMVSKEEELVNFSTTIHPQDAKGMVEKWLLQVHTYIPPPIWPSNYLQGRSNQTGGP